MSSEEGPIVGAAPTVVPVVSTIPETVVDVVVVVLPFPETTIVVPVVSLLPGISVVVDVWHVPHCGKKLVKSASGDCSAKFTGPGTGMSGTHQLDKSQLKDSAS